MRARRSRVLAIATGAVVAVLAILVVVATTTGGGRDNRDGAASGAAAGAAGAPARFLDRYVDPDGRVVRRDQGGDTVSEGQAYAMLISAATGDRKRFYRVWRWTAKHLQRDDGLLSYLWRDGRVADAEPASDADVDAAHALLIAAGRFGDAGLRRDGRRIAAAVLRHETVQTRLGRVLVAGPWAVEGRRINPSYFSPAAFRAMADAGGDLRWTSVERTSYRIVDALTGRAPNLPPDWATVDEAGTASVVGGPGVDPIEDARFGFDAMRVPIRMAASGTRYGRGMAARSWAFFAPRQARSLGSIYRLDGSVAFHGPHAAMLAAAASAAAGSGNDERAQADLRRASRTDAEHPTYYGAAWLALTQLALAEKRSQGPI